MEGVRGGWRRNGPQGLKTKGVSAFMVSASHAQDTESQGFSYEIDG